MPKEEQEVESEPEDEGLDFPEESEEASTKEASEESKEEVEVESSEPEDKKEEYEKPQSEISATENQDEAKKYPYPGLKLMQTMKLALDALGKNDMAGAKNLIKSVISKYPAMQKSVPKSEPEKDMPKKDMTLEQAREFLSEASETIELRDAKIKTMNEEIRQLKATKEKFDEIKETELNSKVDLIVKKELSIGLLDKKEIDDQREFYRKFSEEDLDKQLNRLSSRTNTVIKKESLKGPEETVKKHDLSDEDIKYCELTGVKPETIVEMRKTK